MTTLASRVAAGCAVVVATIGLAAAGPVPKRRVAPPPVCASRSDPGLARTRDAVLAAARARSFPMLRDVLAPTVTYLLFEEYTPDEFVAAGTAWPSQQQEGFWDAVRDVLVAPLVVHAYPGKNPTAISYTRTVDYPDEGWVLITVSRARVRSQPSLQSPILTHLSHEVVPRWAAGPPSGGSPSNSRFVPVHYAANRRGWVDARFTAGPLDFAVIFERIDGVWKVVNFTMGD